MPSTICQQHLQGVTCIRGYAALADSQDHIACPSKNVSLCALPMQNMLSQLPLGQSGHLPQVDTATSAVKE